MNPVMVSVFGPCGWALWSNVHSKEELKVLYGPYCNDAAEAAIVGGAVENACGQRRFHSCGQVYSLSPAAYRMFYRRNLAGISVLRSLQEEKEPRILKSGYSGQLRG
jgi:hypothetical protein